LGNPTRARRASRPRKTAGRKATARKGAAKRRRRGRIDPTTLDGHLRQRLDPQSDALLAFPLFLTYQVGLLLGSDAGSGVDFITGSLVILCQFSLVAYVGLLSGLLAAYGGLLAWLHSRGGFHPRRFVPMLLEAAVYALAMGSLILFVLRKFVELLPMELSTVAARGGFFESLVVSAGAGFHEELVFRLIGLGGLTWLLSRRFGSGVSVVVALVVSSLLFALAHHVGAGNEPFTAGAMAYRSLAGLYFGAIYLFRGFAVAAWTHALYDLYVLSFTP
jgi:hypothetical protein